MRWDCNAHSQVDLPVHPLPTTKDGLAHPSCCCWSTPWLVVEKNGFDGVGAVEGPNPPIQRKAKVHPILVLTGAKGKWIQVWYQTLLYFFPPWWVSTMWKGKQTQSSLKARNHMGSKSRSIIVAQQGIKGDPVNRLVLCWQKGLFSIVTEVLLYGIVTKLHVRSNPENNYVLHCI